MLAELDPEVEWHSAILAPLEGVLNRCSFSRMEALAEAVEITALP